MDDKEFLQKPLFQEIKPEIWTRIGLYYPNITQKTIPLSLAGIHPRTYFDWKENGIVNKAQSEPRGWIKLDLIEFVWVKLLQNLRDFGVPYQIILKLKKVYHDTDAFLKFYDEFKKDPKIISSIYKGKSNEEKKLIQDSLGILDDRNSLPNHMLPLMTIFSSLVLNSLFLEKRSYILFQNNINSEIHFTAFTLEASNTFSFINLISKSSTLCIPLIQLVNSLLESLDHKHIKEIGLINSDEIKVLETIRDGKFDELIIERKKEGEFRISKRESRNIKDKKAQELIKIFGLNDYEEVTLKFRNDKDLYFKSKKVIK